MNFVELSKKLGSTISNMDELIDRAVFDNEEEIIDLNTAQLSKGKDSLDQLLDEYASEEYAKFKKFLGSEAPLGTPNLKLEGDFYRGFKLEKDGDNYILFSVDEKSDRLTFKYGNEIFGLTEKSIEILKPNLLESFLIELRKSLGL
jgi:hypothetical protein